MTTVAHSAPAAPRQAQVPWTRMIWITWRQHRVALAGVLALLCGAGVFLLLTGMSFRATLASLGLDNCRPATSARCVILASEFAGRYTWVGTFSLFLGSAPMLIGAFAGGPLLAREFETGTFRFAWTQGSGRIRLTISKLVLLGLGVAVAAFAFSELYAWWYRPFAAMNGRLESTAYEVGSVVFSARTLLAFALGALAGAVIRRAVAAMAAAMAGWLALVLVSALYLRPHYQAPLTLSWPVGGKQAGATAGAQPRGWFLGDYAIGPGGHRVSDAATAHLSNSQIRGYRWVQYYQPESRFWHFQAIEGAGLLVASLLLGAATVWWVRHRTA